MRNNNEATEQAQKLEIENVVKLFTIYTNSGAILNLVNSSSEGGVEDVQLGNVTFSTLPIDMDEQSFTSDGPAARPTLSVANISGAFSDSDYANSDQFEDILGASVIIRTTFKKFLNRFNSEYPSGSQTDIENSLPLVRKDKYIIDRISGKNIMQITFELASVFDLHNVKIPSKTITGGFCPFIYKGASEEYLDTYGYNTGACNWNNYADADIDRNDIESVSLSSRSIFMTAANEYVVPYNDSTFVQLTLPSVLDTGEGVTIEKDHYYFTSRSGGSTRIKPNGSTELVTNLYDYWQASRDVSNAFEEYHSPSDASNLWRRVRVSTPYNPSKTYSGYTDKTRNEYVVAAEYLPEDTSQAISDFNTSETVTRYLSGDAYVFRRSLLSDTYSLNEINNLVVFTPYGLQLQRFIPNPVAYPATYGLTSELQYSIVTEGGEQFLYTLSPHSTHILSTSLDETGFYYKLYQVSGVSVGTITGGGPPQNNSMWRSGDVCGKNLTSCALRFQALPTTDETEGAFQIQNIKGVEISTVDTAMISSVKSKINIGTDQWSVLPEYGQVSPSFGEEINTLFEEAWTAQTESAEIVTDYSRMSFNRFELGRGGGFTLQVLNAENNNTSLNTTVIGKLFGFTGFHLDGTNVDIADISYPLSTGNISFTFLRYIYLTNTVFAYKKEDDGEGRNISLYYLATPRLTQETDPEEVVQTGLPVTFEEIAGTASIRRLLALTGDSAANFNSTDAAIDPGALLLTLPNKLELDFTGVLQQTGVGAIDQYIATDRQTSIPLPFGGFPGTKRFS